MAGMTRGLGFLFLLVAVTACATSRGASEPEVGSTGTAIDINIENGTGVDLRIIALNGNIQTPLGTVRAMGSRSLRLPRGNYSTIRLMAEPMGGSMRDRLYSEPVNLAIGRRPTWQIRSTGASSVVYGQGGIRP